MSSVQISDILRLAGPTGPGPLASGNIRFSWSAFETAAGQVIPAGNFLYPVTDGVLELELESTTDAHFVGSTTPGIYYSVTFLLVNGNRERELWTFAPSGTPITLADITVISTPPAAATTIGLTQLAQGGAADGDALVWSDTDQAWGPGAGGSGALRVAVATLSSAQLLAADVTPVELIAAPGAGFVIVPQGNITFQYRFGTVAYSGATQWSFQHGGVVTFAPVIGDAGMLFAGSSQLSFSLVGPGLVDDPAVFENQPFQLGLASPVIDGDGDLVVSVPYVVVAIA